MNMPNLQSAQETIPECDENQRPNQRQSKTKPDVQKYKTEMRES